MIATNSPRPTLKSIPFKISTVAPPVRSDFRNPLTTIIDESSADPIAFRNISGDTAAGVFKVSRPLTKMKL